MYVLFCGSIVLEIIWQVTIMFVTLDKIAQTDLKYQDIMLLENYASFQNRYCSLLGSEIYLLYSTKSASSAD